MFRSLSLILTATMIGLFTPCHLLADTPDASTAIPASSTLEYEMNPTGLLKPPPYGWHTDFLGFGRGFFDLSIGLKAWSDRFTFQNLILSGQVDLLPGVRARLELRKRDAYNKYWQVIPDEAYLEAFDQYRGHTLDGGVSLRIGSVRYLHFPFPDAISLFDTVPGIQDLYSNTETDYRSVLLEGELSTHSGWGAHWTGRAAGFSKGDNTSANIIEAYGFYRSSFGKGWRIEGRIGDIAVRRYPVGQPGQPGYDAYLGKQLGEFNVGFLFEHKRTEPDYTGIAIQFRPGPVTKVLGHYTVDYSRRPEGLTAQLPILHVRLNESRHVGRNMVLTGEVRAVRIRTVDVQGLVRNEYEFRLESWGDTGSKGLKCVVRSKPWYLQTEALVSPHKDMLSSSWFHDRAGPGQYVQLVTYRFYRPLHKHIPVGQISQTGKVKTTDSSPGIRLRQ